MLIKNPIKADELIIPDMHIPYHHPDMFNFIDAVRSKYKLPRGHSVKCTGDEIDHHAMSFHDSDPDLMSAGDELIKSIEYLKTLYDWFPNMDLVDGNHGSMKYRRGKHAGIPRAMLKTYNEVLEAPKGWVWHNDLTFKLPNGQKVYMTHGRSADVTKTSQHYGMCAIQGHYHEKFKIEYWGNPNELNWGLQAGCLVDDDSLAMAYNNTNLKRPILGMAVIVDSVPHLIPMIKNKKGRWIGRI